ncbi:hypothetical protein [Aliivibrio fischeri]|uniref:Uncharacterized protein n=1 Tax=Aliivibrio fischeri TaxID=668 RepID=A0A510UIL9_ALIFS|nr:hypothetical protein [Aliivibrio fischeri]GEK13201.1 hypothetical protein AFI02nite_12370 [Aliivibrio fischeri]
MKSLSINKAKNKATKLSADDFIQVLTLAYTYKHDTPPPESLIEAWLEMYKYGQKVVTRRNNNWKTKVLNALDFSMVIALLVVPVTIIASFYAVYGGNPYFFFGAMALLQVGICFKFSVIASHVFNRMSERKNAY